ncbi:MAG: tetratricopeptide repeat protein [Egibacteraceae bacterium]
MERPKRLFASGTRRDATPQRVLRHVLGIWGSWNAPENLHERALDIRERVSGPDHPDTAGSLNNLASTLEDLGDLERSRDLRQRARSSRSSR